ncbi:MAG: hypothetical protein KatS3mg126_1834 [Lysobacteraceae bacterium]|nr:MAG: hypothetical protein KatS3mg126_1834 [Xanthomonadaceae bacterium]
MSLLGACLLVLGGLLVVANLAWSALAVTAHRLREGRLPDRLPLGIPLLGTACLLLGWTTCPLPAPLGLGVALLALLDSGGPLALLADALLYRRRTAGGAGHAAPARLAQGRAGRRPAGRTG